MDKGDTGLELRERSQQVRAPLCLPALPTPGPSWGLSRQPTPALGQCPWGQSGIWSENRVAPPPRPLTLAGHRHSLAGVGEVLNVALQG